MVSGSGTMADFEAALDDNDESYVDAMIECLNEDKLRVFDTVRNRVNTQYSSQWKIQNHCECSSLGVQELSD